MRVGNFEVLLIADSRVLQEVVIDGQTYVCSEPGKEYHVNIGVYRDQRTGKFPAKFLRFGLFIDGIDVQYWKRLDLSNEADLPRDYSVPVCSKFWGFKINVTELKSFVFSTPASTDSAEVATGSSMMGRVQVVVYEAAIVPGTFNNQQSAKEAPTGNRSNAVGTKLLNQASLVTEVGNTITAEKEKFIPLDRWVNVSGTPLETIDLRYHSRSMINLIHQIKAPGSSGVLESGKKRSLSSTDNTDEVNRKFQREEPSSTLATEELEDEDVVEISRPRVAPIADLTDDDGPVWSTTTL